MPFMVMNLYFCFKNSNFNIEIEFTYEGNIHKLNTYVKTHENL